MDEMHRYVTGYALSFVPLIESMAVAGLQQIEESRFC